MHAGGEFGSRTQAGERADDAIRSDDRVFDVAEGGETRAGTDAGVLEHAARADLDRFFENDLPFENAIHVDEHIAPAAQFATHVDARRVGQAHALLHQALGGLPLRDAFEFGQLHLAVHAEHFPFALGCVVPDRHAVGDRHADDVGQVVLLLRVVVRQAAEPFGEARRRQAMMPVLTSRMLRSSGVASFCSTMRTTSPAALRTIRP
jgi:hypothetical protein